MVKERDELACTAPRHRHIVDPGHAIQFFDGNGELQRYCSEAYFAANARDNGCTACGEMFSKDERIAIDTVHHAVYHVRCKPVRRRKGEGA